MRTTSQGASRQLPYKGEPSALLLFLPLLLGEVALRSNDREAFAKITKKYLEKLGEKSKIYPTQAAETVL